MEAAEDSSAYIIQKQLVFPCHWIQPGENRHYISQKSMRAKPVLFTGSENNKFISKIN
jgi:hypothetical protein